MNPEQMAKVPTVPLPPSVPHVLTALCAVMEEMSKEGIAKGRKNKQQDFMFRGIDDIYNHLSSSFARNKVLMLPRTLEREQVERQTKSGGALFYTTVKMEFDFTSAVDGSVKTVGPIYGEAMDSADKSTNKAMSASVKYACIMAFSIPTAGDNDADASHHEVAGKQQEVEPEYDITDWVVKIRDCRSKSDLKHVGGELDAVKDKLSNRALAEVTKHFAGRMRELSAKVKATAEVQQ